MTLVRALSLGLLLLAGSASADSNSKSLQHDVARCKAGNFDACYDAIRWSPHDASLLVNLGDDFMRVGRYADAMRNYRRAAGISPNLPGLAAKMKAVDKMPRSVPKSAPLIVSNQKAQPKQYSNAAADSESH